MRRNNVYLCAQSGKFLQPLEQATRNGFDLTVKLPDSQGTFEWSSRLLNMWLQGFRESIYKVVGNAIQMSRLAPGLADLSKRLEDRAREQQHSAADIAAASQILSETVHSIAVSAAEASGFSGQVAAASPVQMPTMKKTAARSSPSGKAPKHWESRSTH